MANVITGNPLSLDTAADNIFKIGITLHIIGMYWTPAAAADTLLVEDGSEVVIWAPDVVEDGTVTDQVVGNRSIMFGIPFRCSGLSLGTIGGGRLLIYLTHKVDLGS